MVPSPKINKKRTFGSILSLAHLLCIPLVPLLLLLLHHLWLLVCDLSEENGDLVAADAQPFCRIECCLGITGA